MSFKKIGRLTKDLKKELDNISDWKSRYAARMLVIRILLGRHFIKDWHGLKILCGG